MTSSIPPDATRSQAEVVSGAFDPGAPHTALRFPSGFWVAIALIFAVSAVFQLVHPTIPDTSSLFVVDTRWLDGERIYRDFIETNPPMSAFMYMPAVLIERAGWMTADAANVLMTLVLVAATLAVCARLFAPVREPGAITRWVLMAAMMLIAVPTSMFAEREHIALVLILPSLALIERRDAGLGAPLFLRVGLGIASGLAVCIKPHFAVPLALPMLALCIRLRSIRRLFAAEHLVAATVILTYAAIIWVWFQPYLTDVLPMLMDTYRLIRKSPQALVTSPLMLVAFEVVLATVVVLRQEVVRPSVRVPMLAALGFLVAYFEQGKGWVYHLYPTLALLYITFLSEALPEVLRIVRQRGTPLKSKLFSGAAALTVIASIVQITPLLVAFNAQPLALVDRLKNLHPNPRLYVFAGEIAIGQPLTRLIGAQYVGTFAHQFMTFAASEVPVTQHPTEDQRQRLTMRLAQDRAIMASDIRKGKPDIVLVHKDSFPWDEMMASGAEIADLMRQYRRVDTIEGIDILVPSADAPVVHATVSADPRAE